MSNSPFAHKVLADLLLLNTSYSDLFVSQLEHIALAHSELTGAASQDNAGADADGDFWSNYTWARPYNVQNGVLQIPIRGVMLNKFPYQLGGYATGYDYVRESFKRGINDDEVHSIAMIVDTPGGAVSGCFDLCDEIFDMRGIKPIKAFVSDAAYSAGYALASAADTITVTRSGGTGSVGVVTAHVDVSESMKQMGVVHTFIFAGKHKVDGNPYEKLPNDVKARIQKRIDRVYMEFVNLVARNRNLSQDAVMQTEALDYDAKDSLEVGFADTVGKFDEEIAAFESGTAKTEISAMTDNTHTAADVDAARTEGLEAGKKAYQDRMNTILNSDEAKTRPQAAQAAVAMDALTGDQAVAFLASLPEEKSEPTAAEAAATKTAEDAAAAEALAATEATAAAAATAAGTGTPFDTAMNDGTPNVGDNAGGGDVLDPTLTSNQTDYRTMVALEEASATGQTPIQ